MTAGTDHCRPDGLRTQSVFLTTQKALPDCPAQQRADIPKSVDRLFFFDAIRHAAGKGDHRTAVMAKSAPGLSGSKLVQQICPGPQTGCHFQRLGQRFAQIGQLRFRGNVTALQRAQSCQHRRDVGNAPVFINFQQAAAHIQAAGGSDIAIFDQRQIRCATTDIHVQYRLPGFR